MSVPSVTGPCQNLITYQASYDELLEHSQNLYSHDRENSSIVETSTKKQLEELQTTNDRVKCEYFITRQEATPASHTDGSNYTGRRLTAENIEKCFDWLKKEQTLAYICGPLSMLTDMEKMLLTLGMSKEYIKYEKWW